MNVYSLVLALIYYMDTAAGLLCYNCSATHRNWTGCEANFAATNLAFNASRGYLVNCTGENAMCFVRSWATRAQFSWIVQRGCYEAASDDSLPRSMTIPTRAMTCKFERLPNAEYKVCFCQANWCNYGCIGCYKGYIPLIVIIINLLKLLLNG